MIEETLDMIDDLSEQNGRFIAINLLLLTALEKLTMMARTSGGTAGRDEALCAACDEAEAASAKAREMGIAACAPKVADG